MTVGILAVQGDFDAHRRIIAPLVKDVRLVRTQEGLSGIDALIIPGGESTVFLKLLDADFRNALKKLIAKGLPTLATCAGVILLAKHVENPAQDSLELLDVTVLRNGYGRQVDSFIAPELTWTPEGRQIAERLASDPTQSPIEGIFIRAPLITKVGSGAQTILTQDGKPVLVKQGNILGATFHPELSTGTPTVHQLLLALGNLH